MEKADLTKQFSYRLREAMQRANLTSSRSPSGVCINKLAEMTGYTLQICRRYLRGTAIPESTKLMEIAKTLQVTPGWLLFGDTPPALDLSHHVLIKKTLLRYVVTRAAPLYNEKHQTEEVSDFLLSLIENASQIDADEKDVKKMIDLALNSIQQFNS